MIPTIRKPGSEIWVSFNPELETDDTYQLFVVSPPPGAMVVKTGWRDNPALSDELTLEIEHLRTTDPDEYEYDAGQPVDTSWDLGYFDNSAICSPAPTFTALTAYPGTVVRRLYRQGVVSAIS